MEFETQLSIDQAVHSLQVAIRAAGDVPLVHRLNPHMAGDVTTSNVVLYRKRGVSNYYGQFQGRFTTDGRATRLAGRFVRAPGVFMTLWVGFLIAWSVLLTIAVLIRWTWPDSVAWLIAAVLAASVGGGTFWFRAKNAACEAELLRREIAQKLESRGA